MLSNLFEGYRSLRLRGLVMKKIKLLGLVAILAIAIEGCSVISEFSASDKEKTTDSKSSSVEAVDNDNQSEALQPKDESDTPTPQKISGLIPATNPNVRVSGSIRGRQDPFALVKIQPQIEVEVEEIEENAPRSRATNNESGVPTIDSLNDLDNVNNQAKNSEFLTQLAQQVIVTGIVRLGSMTKIIVKAPEEAYTRHVGIGEYVSNGKVLVKRIEGLNSATPKVVLEQKGVEISKEVGELPATSEELDTTALGIEGLESQSLNTAKTWLPNFLSEKLKDSKNN